MDNQTLLSLGNSAIAAIAAVLAAGVAGYWGYRSVKATSDEAKLKDEAARLKRELIAAYRQLAAYHQLEHEFASHLSQHGGKAAKTFKTQFRDRVTGIMGYRPEGNRKDAESRIRALEV